MAGALSDIRLIIKCISSLKERREFIVGNTEKCRLLINRCAKFQSILEKLEKYKILSKNQQQSIRNLKEAITESLELVDTFCQPGWLRLVINVTNAKFYNKRFQDINSTLSDCSSDLQLDIGISTRIAQEEEEAIVRDDHKLIMKIYEMLKINNISISSRLKANILNATGGSNSFDSLDSMESILTTLQSEVPKFNEISGETEMFLDTIYSPDAIMEKNINDDLVKSESTDSNPNLSFITLSPMARNRLSTCFFDMKKMIENVQIDLSLLRDVRDKESKWKPHHRDILGRGSFGIVYKGSYCSQDVAIKVIQGYNSGIPSSEKKMIEREIYILTKCNHLNIVKFVGCDLENGFLLTELCQTNLFNIIYNLYDPLPHYSSEMNNVTMMKLQWLHDIASGLQYLHFFDIIHRDLKPRNILLAVKDSRLTAKITDFGVSTVLGLSSAVQSITGGAVVGTTSYKAPELFNTKIPLRERYSKGVDIYSFGVLANELFAGELPWSGYPPDDVIIEVREGGRPKVFKPIVSDTIELKQQRLLIYIIGTRAKGCFAKDRSRRPEASNISEDLDLIINNPASIHMSSPFRSIQSAATPTKFSSSMTWIHSTLRSLTGSNTKTDLSIFSKESDVSRFSSETTSQASSSPGRGGLVNKVRYQERGELFAAAKQGDVALIAHILNTTDIDVNIRDVNGWTVLIEAATVGRGRVVQYLLDRGADIHAKNNYGYTALLQACREGHSSVIRILLEKGADIDGHENGVLPALLVAALNGRLAAVQLLLDKGAVIDVRDKDWTTPLIAASRYGHLVIVRLLLKKGASIESVDKSGRTAYDWALRNKHQEITYLLLKEKSKTAVQTNQLA